MYMTQESFSRTEQNKSMNAYHISLV